MLKDPKWDKKEITTTTNIYAKAADALEKYGHCKRVLRDEEGRMCLHGAIAYALKGNACYPDHKTSSLVIALTPLVEKMATVPFTDPSYFNPSAANADGRPHPVAWNNHEDTTGDDVIKLLREAALVL